MGRPRLGEILVAAGAIRPDQVESALREQQRWGGQLGQILVAKNHISEEALVEALSRQLSIPIAELGGVRIPKDVLALVPADLAHDHEVLAFRREGRFLDLAMANPLNLGITDELRIRTRLNVRPFIAGSRVIQNALRLNYATSIPVELVGPPTGARPRPAAAVAAREATASAAELTRLQERVTRLEGLVSRDEDIIRKLMRLLIEKSVTSRDEIMAAIR